MRKAGTVGGSAPLIIGTAIAIISLTAGCGATNETPGRSVHPALTSEQHSGPRAEARAYAHRLLADLRLPSGTLRTPSSSGSLTPMLPALLGDVVDLHVLYRVNWPIGRVDAFLAAHTPGGLLAGDAGQVTGPGRPESDNVEYNPRILPPYIYEATLGTTIVPAADGGSLLRVDAQVAWYPPRSAAEHIVPIRYRTVTATAPTRQTGSGDPVTRTFTKHAVVARLAALINGLHARPDITVACGAMSEYTIYRLVFTPVASHGPRVVVSTAGCAIDQVIVGGRPQPALDDGSGLVDAISRLLDLPSPGR